MCSREAKKQKLQSTFNRQIDLFQYYSCPPDESPSIHLAPFTPEQAQTREQMNKYFLIIVLGCFFQSKEKNLLLRKVDGGSSCKGEKLRVLHVRIFRSLVSNTAGL